MSDHHPGNPYNVKHVFEGTNASKSVAIATASTSNPGLVPAASITMPTFIVKSEPAKHAATSTCH
ncbi:hypothetical protein H2248_005722 [Termitomyces sp. 'cryptogamus']|nr:hypothetical protein H2248_005722 [Termitomyces sp. 'cryptogamus']